MRHFVYATLLCTGALAFGCSRDGSGGDTKNAGLAEQTVQDEHQRRERQVKLVAMMREAGIPMPEAGGYQVDPRAVAADAARAAADPLGRLDFPGVIAEQPLVDSPRIQARAAMALTTQDIETTPTVDETTGAHAGTEAIPTAARTPMPVDGGEVDVVGDGDGDGAAGDAGGGDETCPTACATSCATASAFACAYAEAWACAFTVEPFVQVCSWAQSSACGAAMSTVCTTACTDGTLTVNGQVQGGGGGAVSGGVNAQ